MAAATINVVTIYDEVKAALNFNADNTDVTAALSETTYMLEATIKRLMYQRVRGNSTQTYTCDLVATGIWLPSKPQYDYWLLPTFTGATASPTGPVYNLNATGSIELTSLTDTTSQYVVTATPVQFALLMTDLFRYLANHMARQAQENYGPTSYSPLSVSAQLMAQATYWTTEHYTYN